MNADLVDTAINTPPTFSNEIDSLYKRRCKAAREEQESGANALSPLDLDDVAGDVDILLRRNG